MSKYSKNIEDIQNLCKLFEDLEKLFNNVDWRCVVPGCEEAYRRANDAMHTLGSDLDSLASQGRSAVGITEFPNE